MATTPHRAGSDATTTPVPFSYAQAAKGLASSTSTTAQSKPSTGTSTPAKDVSATPATAPTSITSWADDAEANAPHPENQPSQRERSRGASSGPKSGAAQNNTAASSISSPDLGASSSSTVTKDDDISSLPNTSSDSTWENKSQASVSADKPTESAEKTPEKAKSNEVEPPSFKPLQEAPAPAVNIWQQRMVEQKAKAQAQKPSPAKPATAVATTTKVNGAPPTPIGTGQRKPRLGASDAPDVKEKGTHTEAKSRTREEEKEKPAPQRKDSRPEIEVEKARKGMKSRPVEKEAKPPQAVLPLPPDRDQASWPTPFLAVDEDKKKVQGKVDKGEKERKENVTSRPHGKQEWVPVPYTPSYIFNTPLPNAAASRRGGRGGGRGGAQNGGRGGGVNPNSAGLPEKDIPTTSSAQTGEQPKRGRTDGSAGRDLSPVKNKRTGSTGSTTLKEYKPLTNSGEKFSPASGAENEAPSRRAPDSATGPNVTNQNNTFPRQHQTHRSTKGRRGDFPVQGDKRKDGELMSPTGPFDQRTSVPNQPELTDDPERRTTSISEGQSSQSKSGPNDRRPFGSFSGRERGRGGPRPRGTYQNGHQFSNGHNGQHQSSSSFPLRSPTNFHPDNAYFAPPPGQSRSARSNGRTQSVSAENMYGRVSGFPGSHGITPIQTFVPPGTYDYQAMQPMSAMPYPSFVEPFQLLSIVSTQLAYYFSVDNLCKDMFLRKHMDSKGFVHLEVIAGFNRIKNLTTDLELVKLACHQTPTLELRTGVDGKDRLRPRIGWKQWVLDMAEREPSAQNDGMEELPVSAAPHVNGFDRSNGPRFSEMPTGPGMGLPPYGAEMQFAPVNGVHPNGLQGMSLPQEDSTPNGAHVEGMDDPVVLNGRASPFSATTVNGVNAEADSFSDEATQTLSVIVRKQEQSQSSNAPSLAHRTFSNGSINSNSGGLNDAEKGSAHEPGIKINGTVPFQGTESVIQDIPRRALSPFVPATTTTTPPVRLYWVKGKDAPVESLPPDSTYESYLHLRAKALEQRQSAFPGSCPYDMDVLYQFWSHFLIRNFNSRMYIEFRQLAFADSEEDLSDVGMQNLIKFYGEALLSTQSLIREQVARHYIDLVKQEQEHGGQKPAFRQLRSAWRNGALDPRSRKRIMDLIDADLTSVLEQ